MGCFPGTFLRRIALFCGMAVAAAAGGQAARAQQSAPGFESGETVSYKLLWPSRMPLGEAIFRVTPSGENLHFEVTMEADLPAHNISASFKATATRKDLCSLEFHSTVVEGKKTSEESIQFDQQNHEATRVVHGQSATASVPTCARDPLTFLYYMRRQIASGAATQNIDTKSFFLGPDRNLAIRRVGSESISVRGGQQDADRYRISFNVKNAEKSLDVWISKDARRVPLLIRWEFPLAVFSAEIE